jgi:hypothetical protein
MDAHGWRGLFSEDQASHETLFLDALCGQRHLLELAASAEPEGRADGVHGIWGLFPQFEASSHLFSSRSCLDSGAHRRAADLPASPLIIQPARVLLFQPI